MMCIRQRLGVWLMPWLRKPLVEHWVLTLATGYMLTFFSEHMFWSRYRPGEDSLLNYLLVWLVYSCIAFIFLCLVRFFRIRTRWALFLAGAAVGWLAEGVIVQTTYEALPLSISFTSLAWHAPITVLLGWYTLRRWLLVAKPARLLALCGLIGLGWGVWAITWWYEDPNQISTPLNFALFAFAATLFLILAHRVYDRFPPEHFQPSRVEVIMLSVLFVLYFLVVTVPVAPLALLILPMLALLLYLPLRRNRNSEPPGSLLSALGGHVGWRDHLFLLAIPLVASLVYTLAHDLGIIAPSSWLLYLMYLITTPLGFILLGFSIVKIWRTPNP